MIGCFLKWIDAWINGCFFKLRATPRSGSQSAKAKSSKHRVDASGDKQGWLDFSKTFKKGSFSLEDFEENPSDEEEDEEEEETLPKDLMTTLKMKTGKDKDKDKAEKEQKASKWEAGIKPLKCYPGLRFFGVGLCFYH